MLERIEAAVLGISVVTLAETRFGCLKAKWGPRLIGQVPLDMEVVEQWARVRALCRPRLSARYLRQAPVDD